MPTIVTKRREPPARRRSAAEASTTKAADRAGESRFETLWLSLAASVLMYAALPPLDWWPLAWIAPIGWLLLCRPKKLPGRRPWLALWVSGFVFWLAALQWLRLPHPATALGWVALSFYFAFYIPAFVWLSRGAAHTWRVPLVLAAPIVWTGLELARGHLLTGLTYASLGHTQYRWLALIQIADVAGAYGVSFVVMLVAAALACVIPFKGSRGSRWPLVAAAGVVTLTLAYGYWRLSDSQSLAPGPKVALIQGSIDTEVKSDPNQRFAIYQQYLELSERAMRLHPDLELLVWPETMFREPLITFAADFQPPPNAEWTAEDAREAARQSLIFIAETVRGLKVPAILGADRQNLTRGKIEHYNAALYVDRDGRILGRYEKVHPVMFGEYIPFADWFPWLYEISPLAAGLKPGPGPRNFQLGRYRTSANICFENVLPHLIRNQVNTLRSQGEEPDLLVNLTNDGWFWGSSELDLHLMCAVFRAVEMRKPFLVAANTGISATIDSRGQILDQGPRRATAVVYAPLSIDRRRSLYARYGDVPAGLCLVFCGLLAGGPVFGWVRSRFKHQECAAAAN